MFRKNLVKVRLIRDKSKQPKVILKDEKMAYKYVKSLEEYDREAFVGIYLDSRNQVLCTHEISVGTLNSSLVHPREIFKVAILVNAAAIILAHNHPSGNCEPSDADIELTKMISKAGKIVGIELLDHLVIGEDSYKSLSQEIEPSEEKNLYKT